MTERREAAARRPPRPPTTLRSLPPPGITEPRLPGTTETRLDLGGADAPTSWPVHSETPPHSALVSCEPALAAPALDEKGSIGSVSPEPEPT